MMREAIARAICSASQGEWRSGRYNMGGITIDQDELNNHWRHKAQAALDAISEAGGIVGTWPEVLSLVRNSIAQDAANLVRKGEIIPNDLLAAHEVIGAMIEASQESE